MLKKKWTKCLWLSRLKINLNVTFILNITNSSDVVMILSQLLFITQAVVPVTQLLISGRME